MQQQTMIRQLHRSPALLEISGTYDMDMVLPQSFASSISSSHHLTLANVFHAFTPRKLANLSLHQSQKRKPNWNEYIQISVGNFQTLRTTLPTISSSSTNLHAGHTPSISRQIFCYPQRKIPGIYC